MRLKSYLLTLIALASLSLSCKDHKSDIQGYWIGIFRVSHNTFVAGDKPALVEKHDGYYLDTIELNEIAFFNNDTFVLTNFNETLYYGFNENKFNFDIDKDSIMIEHEEEKIPFSYSCDGDNSLVINFTIPEYDGWHANHFIRVEEFGLAPRKSEINHFLTTNPITLDGRRYRIELQSPRWQHMGAFIQDSLEADYGFGNDWYFYTLEKELFLIIGEKLVHLSDFSNQKLYGYVYNDIPSKF